MCMPGTQMTSIFEGQFPPKIGLFESKQGSCLGFQVYMCILITKNHVCVLFPTFPKLVGGFNPLVKLDHFPRDRDEHKQHSKPATFPKPTSEKPVKTNAHLTFFHLSHHLQALQPPQSGRPWISYDRSWPGDPPPRLLGEYLGYKQMQQWKKGAPGCLRYLGIIS